MTITLLHRLRNRAALAACGLMTGFFGFAQAQEPPAAPPAKNAAAPLTVENLPTGGRFIVRGASERLDMIVNTSRIVEFPYEVPKLLVNNPDLITAVPLTPRSVQISAKKTGVTHLNVWNRDNEINTIDITVLGDVRELDAVLKAEFPEAALRLRPLNSSLYITGFVPKAELVSQIKRVAEDYFPKIIDNMTVGGVQTVLLHVKAIEVSRTKLRTMGFDWQLINGNDFVTLGTAGLGVPAADVLSGVTPKAGNNLRFGITDSATQFTGFLEALRQNDLAKLLAEPTLTTMSGRPATFNVGGEVPIPIASGLGTNTIQFKEFGTQVDFVPIVLGNGLVRLEVRPIVSEIDPSLRDSVTGTVGFRTRRADVGVEMRSGQTLAIAGLVYNRVESQTRGVPWLMDLPWVGSGFRRVSDKVNEIELVILVRPEFADAMEPCEVPCGPGQTTTSPNDVELYGRGYIEVPKCAENCIDGQPGVVNDYIGGRAGGMPSGMQGGLAPVYTPAQTGLRPNASPRMASGVPAPRTAGYSNGQTGNNRHSPQTPPVRSAKAPTKGNATLIGPLGYDELR
jgi:pilus assembly protein CpaC